MEEIKMNTHEFVEEYKFFSRSLIGNVYNLNREELNSVEAIVKVKGRLVIKPQKLINWFVDHGITPDNAVSRIKGMKIKKEVRNHIFMYSDEQMFEQLEEFLKTPQKRKEQELKCDFLGDTQMIVDQEKLPYSNKQEEPYKLIHENERFNILGGDVECPCGKFEDDNEVIMQVYAQTKQISIITCLYIEMCINNFDKAVSLLSKVAEKIEDEEIETEIADFIMTARKHIDVIAENRNAKF